jgi:hypothetical protein
VAKCKKIFEKVATSNNTIEAHHKAGINYKASMGAKIVKCEEYAPAKFANSLYREKVSQFCVRNYKKSYKFHRVIFFPF